MTVRHIIDMSRAEHARLRALHGAEFPDRINAALERERDECDALRERMADLLTRTTNALKGEPAELELHSWHDLPDVAVAIRSRNAALVKAVEWYGEQSRLCRLIHSEGDAGRHALARDGGERARAALAAVEAAVKGGEQR